MLGDREAVIREIRHVDVHGSRFVDVTVAYEGGALETARLGVESVPGDLEAGQRVVVARAVNMIVAIRRP
ncbi:MAG: hypothetical protein ACRDHU_09895 [Actinomycetota bacterium]